MARDLIRTETGVVFGGGVIASLLGADGVMDEGLSLFLLGVVVKCWRKTERFGVVLEADVDIDAVEDRARELASVGIERGGRAGALMIG